MKKVKNTALTLLVIFILGLLGVATFFQVKMAKLMCETAAYYSQTKYGHCLKEAAVFMLEPELCAIIPFAAGALENPVQSECYSEVAAKSNDSGLCEKAEGILIANTRIDCLYRVAAMNKNSAACDLIGKEHQSRVGMRMDKAGCLAQFSQ